MASIVEKTCKKSVYDNLIIQLEKIDSSQTHVRHSKDYNLNHVTDRLQ